MQATNIQSDHSLLSDEALMQQYAQGDFGAFEQLYQRHKGGLYRYFLRQLADKTLAEDLFQEIWSKVISHAAQYQTTAKFSTWLYTLARHKLVDHVRHLKVVAKVIEETEQDSQQQTMSADTGLHKTPENLWQDSKAAEALKGCIEYLPVVQRECFLLKEEAGLSLDAIAQIVDANYEACKSRLRKAYEGLRQCIERKIGGKLND
jgi:RNA polymerase sigma-70 factor (ECF subfamily)